MIRVDWNTPHAPYGTLRDFAQFLRNENHGWNAIAIQISDALGQYVSGDAIRQAVQKTSKSEPLQVVENTVKPEFIDKVTPDVSLERLLEKARVGEEQARKSQYWQDRAKVEVKAERPIIVVHSADWHVGSLATDIEMFGEWIAKMLSTPNLYMITAGDELEQRGQFKSILPTLLQSLSPEEQIWLLEDLWDKLTKAGKLLCCAWGNHTVSQHEKVWGFSPVSQMMAKKIPYFRGVGYLTLQVGQVEYTYRINHADRYNSGYNPTHSPKQAARMARDCVDVMVNAHTHNPAIEQGQDEHGRFVAIKCGTFKTDDDYSQRHFKQGVFCAPCVVFHSDRKQMVPFWSVDEAEAYVAGV